MNDHQRRQQEQQAAQRRFLSALSSGQVHARDRFNNAITEGMKVLFKTEFDLVFDVVSVTPNLDPRVQPGTMTIQMSCTVPMPVVANQPIPHLIVIGQASKKPELTIVRPDAPEETADPPTAEPAAVQGDGADLGGSVAVDPDQPF